MRLKTEESVLQGVKATKTAVNDRLRAGVSVKSHYLKINDSLLDFMISYYNISLFRPDPASMRVCRRRGAVNVEKVTKMG